MPSKDDPKKQTPPRPGDTNGLENLGMDELLNLYDKPASVEGEIVTGRVLKVTPSDIVVDIGYKSEGLLPASEVTGFDGKVKVKPGDEIEVFVERLEDQSGYVILSREKAARMRIWDEIESAYKAEEAISGRVIDRVKGGLSVDVGGVKAFLPGSLIDTKPVKNLDALRGHEYRFKIVSFDKKRSNIVLSRRAIVEVEHAAQKADTFGRLEEGKLTHGTVKNITDYGVFVDLGGVDGLLHITDISWGRVNHPSEYFNVGDELEVVVLKFDPAAERVSLGYKQKSPDPWSDVVERYPLGTKVHGRVVSLADYGAFVELEEGVEGLIHVSEMSWTKKVRNPSKLLSVGTEVEAVVSDVNVQNRRISLSLKALEQNPWDTIAERYPVGSVISGRVRNLTDFGAFVEVEEGIDGLIHISDMSWNRRLKHPNEVLKKGDVVQARVINVDGENQRLSLSVREFLPNEWENYAKGHNLGDEVVGIVSKITDFGLFVRLADGVEGLAHVSEINRDQKQKLDKQYQPGDPLRARILKIDPNDRKIGLTTRDVEPLSDEERAELMGGAAHEEGAPAHEDASHDHIPHADVPHDEVPAEESADVTEEPSSQS
ncbi:MAG TPA: 30S ribosomal protein S1 [Thermoanaerobaculia bacterium]|jgi:small subunit ribosomal protein S1|nr:30S ribosomal protein S1 [Thermoanaerobaculia bacterium]